MKLKRDIKFKGSSITSSSNQPCIYNMILLAEREN